MDLRERIVARYQRGDVTYAQLAETFGIGEATVSRLLRRNRERGVLERDAPGGGFPPRIAPDQLACLVKLVAEKPDRTVPELCEVWMARHGGFLSESSMKRALARAGVTRKKRPSDPASKTVPTSKTSVERSWKK